MSLILLGILNSQAAGAAAAGGYDLLETQVLGTTAASVTFTGLGSYTDYKHLQIRMVVGATPTGSGSNSMKINFNNDTVTDYATHYLRGDGSSVTSGANTFDNAFYLANSVTLTADSFSAIVCDILDFSSTNKNTTGRALQGHADAGQNRINLWSGAWFDTSAVTEIDFTLNANSFRTGSRFSLYGVK